MNLKNIISSIFLFSLGLGVLIKGIHLGVKTNLQMSPGFFPFISGGILCGLSIILFFQSTIKKMDEEKRFLLSKPQRKLSLFFTLLAIGIYVFILNKIGFLLSTFLFLLFLFKGIGRLKWLIAILGGVSTAVLTYLIFETWLKANLPRGILSF